MPKLVSRGERKKARGFTLVELLVVIAIIGILASLLTPVLMKARQEGMKTDCKNNLRQLSICCSNYADGNRGLYPFNKGLQGGAPAELQGESDARACFELLVKFGYLDDPRIFICKAPGLDQAADMSDDERQRRETFHLDEFNCSFTYRKKLISSGNSDSRTPVSADKRGIEDAIANHKDGRNIVFLGNNVQFFRNDELEQANNRDTRRPRAELIGFERIGAGGP